MISKLIDELYLIEPIFSSRDLVIVNKQNLIPMLANDKYNNSIWNWTTKKGNQTIYHTNLCIIKYNNVKNARLEYNYGFPYFKCDYETKTSLTDTEIGHLIRQAKNYLEKRKKLEPKIYWSGQTNYLAKAGLLGHSLKLLKIIKHEPTIKRHYPMHFLRHTTSGYKHVNNRSVQNAFQKDNHRAVLARRQLKYAQYPIRHPNKTYRKQHLEDFPVFDDDEYIRHRRSSGWKESTKCRYQYMIHIK